MGTILRLIWLLTLLLCLFSVPSVKGQDSLDSLFEQFSEDSFENVEKFKTDMIHLLKRQNYYLSKIQNDLHDGHLQAKEDVKFVVELPEETVQFQEQKHISYPRPNVQRNNSQLAVSFSEDNRLNIWSVRGGSNVQFLDSFPLRIQSEDFTSVKVMSFVQNRVPSGWINYRRAHFRLVVVTLWQWNRDSVVGDNGRILITDDKITVHVLNGFFDENGVSSFKPLNSGSLIPEQTIKFDSIIDFDILQVDQLEASESSYLSVIQNNDESNAKFQLDLFQLKESKYDRVASLQANEMINAYRVKLAKFNSQLYIVCSYDRSIQDLKYYPIISIYKHVESFDANKLELEASLRNESQISRIESIHYLPGNDFIFMQQQESIIVYWFNGGSFVFYTEIKPDFQAPDGFGSSNVLRGNIVSFGLSEMPNSQPLIVSAYERDLVLHYLYHDTFHSSLIKLEDVPQGYRVSNMRVFYANMYYYLWLSFESLPGFRNQFHRFSQFRRVVFKSPDSDEDIRTYGYCTNDLTRRIENGIRHVKNIEKKSENLLVINPLKPEVNVDVIVEDTFQSDHTPQEMALTVDRNNQFTGQVLENEAKRLDVILQERAAFIDSNVAMRTENHTFTSPVLFKNPVKTNRLSIMQVDGHFKLNGVDFDVYFNNSLTIHGDQTLFYDSPIVFNNGLNVDFLNSHQINGVQLEKAVNIHSRDAVTITGQHHYDNLVLFNGTTAEKINEVRLVHVFQDRPSHHAAQLFNGRKHFRKLSTDTIRVDNLFNGFNLKGFFENLIWLERDGFKHQFVNGSTLTFNGPIHANSTVIGNSVNNVLFVEDLARHAVRTNVETVLSGPIVIENGALSEAPVSYDGLLNGEIDLWRDVVLLKGDQDFRHFTSGQIVFDSLLQAQHLDFGLLNSGISSQEFLLRSELVNRKNIPEYSMGVNYQVPPLLSNKHFLKEVYVAHNVDIRDEAQINGYDLSEMYKQLDTVSSFNTPLTVKEIVVRGDLKSQHYNNIPAEELKPFAESRLRKTVPQIINSPLAYFNGPIDVDDLYFNYTKSGLRFPQDFVRKSPLGHVEDALTFSSLKYFDQSVSMNNLVLEQPNGLVNGYRISDFYNTLLKNDSLRSENIQGRKKFTNLVIEGDLNIETGVVNENFLDNAVLLNRDQNISKSLHFQDVLVRANEFRTQDLKIQGYLNGQNFEEFAEDVVLNENDVVIQLANKNFDKGLVLENLDLSPQSLVSDIDLGLLLKNSVMLDQEQGIEATLNFHTVTFENVQAFKTINGLTPDYFKSAVLKSSNPIRIAGEKNFHKDISISNLIVESCMINAHNVTDLIQNALFKNADQNFIERPIFLGPLSFKHLSVADNIKFGEEFYGNYVKLDKEVVVISSEVVFENLRHINSDLNVHGRISGCNFTELARHVVLPNLDRSYSIHHPRLAHLNVEKNLVLPPILNSEENFLGQIVRVQDPRPLRVPLVFGEHVIANNLIVNDRINNINITLLLQDAVYQHLPQVISGRNIFRQPLEIFGHLTQPQGNGGIFSFAPKTTVRSGMLNHVNITRLYETTVTTEDDLSIVGSKHFTGRIRFKDSLNSRDGLNGLRVPQDYHLVFTNETIVGEVNFLKKVHIHHDLDVRLINEINITDFADNCIYIQPVVQIYDQPPKQVDVEEISSILRFDDSIYVKNLTIIEEINDIHIGDLIPEDAKNVTVTGIKHFTDVQPIKVYGALNVVTVNKKNFEQDLKNEWIDTRNEEPVRVTGSIRLKAPTSLDQLTIGKRINNFNVDQINGEFFKKLDHQIRQLNQSIGDEIQHFDRIGRNLEEQVDTEFLFEIRFFVEVQRFAGRLVDFYVNSFFVEREHLTEFIAVEDEHIVPNRTHVCRRFNSKFFVQNRPEKFIHQDLATFGGHGKAHFNMKASFAHSINSPLDKFVVQSIYSSGPICSNVLKLGENVRISHQLSFFEQKFFPDMTLNLGYFNETLLEVSKIRAFSVDSNTKIVVVLFKNQAFKTTKLEVYRTDLHNRLFVLAQYLENMHIVDFDLVDFEGKIWMSLAYELVGQQSSSIMQWNGRQFASTPSKIDQFLHSDNRYSKTRFLNTPFGLLLAYSTVPDPVDSLSRADCSSTASAARESEEHYLDLWLWHANTIEHFQRISLGVVSSNGLDRGSAADIGMATFGKMVYLFAASGQDELSIFRLEGANRFQLWSNYVVPDLSSIDVFWNRKALFISLGSQRENQSRLLKAVISGASKSMQYFEESMLESHTLKARHDSTGAVRV